MRWSSRPLALQFIGFSSSVHTMNMGYLSSHFPQTIQVYLNCIVSSDFNNHYLKTMGNLMLHLQHSLFSNSNTSTFTSNQRISILFSIIVKYYKSMSFENMALAMERKPHYEGKKHFGSSKQRPMNALGVDNESHMHVRVTFCVPNFTRGIPCPLPCPPLYTTQAQIAESQPNVQQYALSCIQACTKCVVCNAIEPGA